MGQKSLLRQQLVARRAALSGQQLAAAGTALAEAVLPLCRGARSVAAYAAVGSEPPTAPLLEALEEVRVLLPVLLPGGDLDWAEHRPHGLVPAGRGLLEPAGPRLGADAVAECDVVLVPALAVDAEGHRLGRGGGSYDRALTRTGGLVVALLHDGELLPAVPVEAHDVAVGAVTTPAAGLLHLPQPTGAPWPPDRMGT